ncbi:hypothetical protein EPN44_16075 [bacterium]|nr:MAG: hypothetical protein EPN44_16075 [bacterium]
MEQHPTIRDGWQQIQRTALDMADAERRRQIFDKGYSHDHDDQHRAEELAAAAAFYLMPQSVNQDVCVSVGEGDLILKSLHELIGDEAWEGLFADDYADPSIRADVAMDTRINQLVKGVALGLAELERWLRMRELRDEIEAFNVKATADSEDGYCQARRQPDGSIRVQTHPHVTDAEAASLRDQLDVALHVPAPEQPINPPSRL